MAKKLLPWLVTEDGQKNLENWNQVETWIQNQDAFKRWSNCDPDMDIDTEELMFQLDWESTEWDELVVTAVLEEWSLEWLLEIIDEEVDDASI